MIIPRSFGTHDGTFHADEVTACALLLIYNLIDRDKIHRTRNTQDLETYAFVCDVGGQYCLESKRFDHHQVSYQGELSSAGMVWRYLKEMQIVDEPTYWFLHRSLISGVDAHDNGRGSLESGVCTFSQIISNFVPIHYDVSAQDQDLAFFEALHFVVGHIQRSLDRFAYIQQCRDVVREAMLEGKEYLSFAQPMPWLDAFFELGGEQHSAQFVIMPSGGRWKLRGIPPTSDDRMKVRKSLPKKWAGLLEKDLKIASGISGAVFCHKGLFISVWETREDALKAMECALLEGESYDDSIRKNRKGRVALSKSV
jgi:uncharacterized UPF0160 family protein